jgi:hypothetical protein
MTVRLSSLRIDGKNFPGAQVGLPTLLGRLLWLTTTPQTV